MHMKSVNAIIGVVLLVLGGVAFFRILDDHIFWAVVTAVIALSSAIEFFKMSKPTYKQKWVWLNVISALIVLAIFFYSFV